MSKKDPADGMGTMPFSSHLDELRRRLFKSLLVLGVIFLVGWIGFGGTLEEFFMAPHHKAVDALAVYDPPVDVPRRLQLLSPLENVFYRLKVSALVAVLVGFPFLLYQMWSFIATGLLPPEKRAMMRFLPWSVVFALIGIAFGYFFMVPMILEFLYAIPDPELMEQAYRLQDYFSIFLMFTIALALIFQLPIVMMGVGSFGLVSPKFFRKYRRHFILIAFVVGAMLTPPEPFSQILMATPTILLYELGIILMTISARTKAKREKKSTLTSASQSKTESQAKAESPSDSESEETSADKE